MNEIELFQMIGKFGFPTVIAVYLLTRFEKKLDKFEETILELAKAVSQKK